MDPDFGLSPQNSLCESQQARLHHQRHRGQHRWTLENIYQVLHLLLQSGHGLLGTNSKDKRVHVVIIKRHFDLLQTDGGAEPFLNLV